MDFQIELCCRYFGFFYYATFWAILWKIWRIFFLIIWSLCLKHDKFIMHSMHSKLVCLSKLNSNNNDSICPFFIQYKPVMFYTGNLREGKGSVKLTSSLRLCLNKKVNVTDNNKDTSLVHNLSIYLDVRYRKHLLRIVDLLIKLTCFVKKEKKTILKAAHQN